MDLMDIQDISSIDINELGVRPLNWIGDDNDIDFDHGTYGYFGKEKLNEFQRISNEKKFPSDEDDISMCDEDDSNYETDPETGEKTFREVVVALSPTLSSSNDKWIEEYLINIESSSSSSSNQLLPTVTNSDLLFEDIPFSHTNHTNINWLSRYIPLADSTNRMMFPEQFLSSQFIADSGKNLPQSTSPIFIPTATKNNHDSLLNLLSISVDDEHSISGSSNSSRRQRLFSSLESDSTTRDSELTFDGSLIETKLEKIEHDEHSIPHMFLRRSSSLRTNYQGQQDEEILRGYHIPLTLYDITQSSTEEYNRHLARLNYLTPEQLHIIKDIRRRGKNKVAAQNCRKRKASSVETLLEEVDELKRVKHELEERKKSYQQQIAETRHLYEYLHRQVLPDRQLPPAIIVK